VKRLTKYLLGVTATVLLFGLVVTLAAWVAGTTEGTRWFLRLVPPLVGMHISAEKVEGRLSDRLHLTGVRIDRLRQKLELDSLELSWRPRKLLSGSVDITELSLHGVRIQDNTPAVKTTDLSWPRVSGIAAHLDGTIARLRLVSLSYRHLAEQPILVNSITAGVAWHDTLLSIKELSGSTPAGRFTGHFSAGFNHPSLTADLAVVPSQPTAGMDLINLSIRSVPGKSAAPFVGGILVAGRSGGSTILELTGEVAMARTAFNLRRLRLIRPGRRGRITAEGTIDFPKRESVLTLQVKANDLDLAPELHMPTDLSGTLTFTGTLVDYRGTFNVANKGKGWHAAAASGSYQGTGSGLKLAPFNGTIIDGTLGGNLDLDWREGLTLHGTLQARNLNPARLAADWQGVANFNVAGSLAWIGNAPVQGELSGDILESRLHGQALTGQVRARFADSDLAIDRLALQGKGFDIHASGKLSQRLAVAADISDFSRLVPGTAGTLKADGWVRRSNGRFTGAVTGQGKNLAAGGTRIAAAELTARLNEGPDSPLQVAASLRQVVYDRYKADAVTVAADGTVQHHTVTATLRSSGAHALLTLAGGYGSGTWQGEIARFEGRDRTGPWSLAGSAAVAVSAGKISLAPLIIRGVGAERLEVTAELNRQPLSGPIRAHWDGLNLARANPYMQDEQFTGRSNGTIKVDLLPGQRLSLNGRAAASGTVSARGHTVTVKQGTVNFAGDEQGLHVGLELTTASGGSLKGSFSSPSPFQLAMPDRGEMTAELTGIDLALFQPWLPRDLRLTGLISGRAKGALLSGQHLELDGTVALSGGKVHWERPDGELNFNLRGGDISWVWREETLSGTVAVTMAEYGQIKGSFQLPVPASFPIAARPQGALRAALTGKVREKGLITALFPGLVQESYGELDADLKVGGSWETPQVEGVFHLAKSGAYLPTAGIRVKDVQLTAHLEKNLIRIDSFRAVSGPGHLEGTALLTLSGLQVTGYRGTVTGEGFQTVDFPELQLRSSPKLTFEGTPEKLSVRGELRLPELRIIGSQSRKVIQPSSDVIVEGRTLPTAKTHPLDLDVQVRVLLGDQVFVKVAGIDAQLGGAIDLSMRNLDRITSKGEITVTKGRYRTYGVNLQIVRGRLFYPGGPIDRPTLDFLALRTIGDVRAGVTVSGTLQKPVTRLYSEPAMPDVDVLAYIVLGHPLGSNTAQANLVAQAAGVLLSTSQSEALQEQLKNRLGLSTFEIQGGVGGTTSHMGYKPLQVTPPGAIPATQQPGITETMMTVGKYLTPKLYISYGRSLFTGTNLFTLRYDISRKWQIESQAGSESGVDLFYKLEFN
jgi:translocation and assembly module TamB